MSLAAAALAAFLVAASPPVPAPGTPVGGGIVACDTEDEMRQVFDAHETGGLETGMYVLAQMNRKRNAEGGPACGVMRGVFMVVRVIDTGWLDYKDGQKLWSVLVEALARNGRHYFAVLVHPTARPPQGA